MTRSAAPLLDVRDLHVEVQGNAVLRGINLQIGHGEMHVIMGPNGSGKSTLAAVLAGREEYRVTAGSICYRGEDLLALQPEERARRGLLLGFQYPVEIPGLSNMEFLRAAVDAMAAQGDEPAPEPVALINRARELCKMLHLDPETLKRGVNEGFSGGEKKRNEMLQLLMLNPLLAVLDEMDSGLDIDALQVVAAAISRLYEQDSTPPRSVLLVTHYQRLLEHLQPTCVHVQIDGQIVHSGGANLALALEQQGYGWLADEDPAAKQSAP